MLSAIAAAKDSASLENCPSCVGGKIESIPIAAWESRMTSGKYFNKGVKALDAPDIGQLNREGINMYFSFIGET